MILSFKKEAVEITSKRKWLIIGFIIAFLNPIFSGLVVSFGFITEPKLRREGKIILVFSFIWAIALTYIVELLKNKGYL